MFDMRVHGLGSGAALQVKLGRCLKAPGILRSSGRLAPKKGPLRGGEVRCAVDTIFSVLGVDGSQVHYRKF